MTLLSKTKYLAGRQCPKRLWLEVHSPEFGNYDPATTQRLETGAELGRRAHELFPGGLLVEHESGRHEEAVTRTMDLLAHSGVPAIFEAAFIHAGVRVRVDILERLPNSAWGLREVKSTSGVKDVHLHDVAVQRFVLEGAGVRVPSVEVIHVDTSYIRGDEGIDWRRFFRRADVTAMVDPLRQGLPEDVDAMHAVLAQPKCPLTEPSAHCFSPYGCKFWTHCTQTKPDDWVFHLPGRSRFEALRALGIERIVDIPDDFPLTARQQRMRDVLRSGEEYVSSDLATALTILGPPTAYLDFETMNPAIPLYPGTRPYQRIPFQWSLHQMGSDGAVVHREFLADGRKDPRWEFVATLVGALGDSREPIAVYSGFEGSVLAELATVVPSQAGTLSDLRSRLVDLLPIVRTHTYHPAFEGSFSVKAVAPALAPGFSYDDLEGIGDGDAASDAFLTIARAAAGDETALRQALLAYCKRDTLAMVELHRALRRRTELVR